MPGTPRARATTRSAATRARLVATAERLFAERGIDGVSLNEISRAAGQRNASVCQYHFGDRDALLQAILDKHLPGITARRHELLDALERDAAADVRSLVRAFIVPVAEKLRDPDGGVHFVQVNAQLVALHTLYAIGAPASPLRLATAERWRRAIVAALAANGLSRATIRQRLILASALLFHGLADRCRMQLAAGGRKFSLDGRALVAELEDAIVGLCTAPVVAARSRTSRAGVPNVRSKQFP